MRIIKLLYLKYTLSFFICLFSCFVIFFIFSLISNLSEEYVFSIILNLSFLNSFQIVAYVPAFIFLISIILFLILLRSKNEIIIIKSYLNVNKLIIFFLPIMLVFTIFEVNKTHVTNYIEDYKQNLMNVNYQSKIKILIKNFVDHKTITILNNIDLNDLEKSEYRSYNISNKEINLAEFSNKLINLNNTLILENYTQIKENVIKDHETQKSIDLDLISLISESSLVKDIPISKNMKLDIEQINLHIFFIIFFCYVFLTFFSSKYMGLKQSLRNPILICLGMLLYTLFVFNNSLNSHKHMFELLATLVIIMLFFKSYLNE